LASSTVALAGEVKGPPTDENRPDAPRLSNGKSWCSFSGLNDTPEGQGDLGDPDYDPGGIAQSYGYFHSQGLFDPSDPDQRDQFAFPGTGCNPTRSFPIPG
jgi:hypothetical protein